MDLSEINYRLVPKTGARVESVRNDQESEASIDLEIDLDDRENVWHILGELADAANPAFMNIVTMFFEHAFGIGSDAVENVDGEPAEVSRLGEFPCLISLTNFHGDFTMECKFLGPYESMLEKGDTGIGVIVMDEGFRTFGEKVWRSIDALDDVVQGNITGLINCLMKQAYAYGQKMSGR